MSVGKERRKVLAEQGLCTRCGGQLDMPGKYNTCAKCRETTRRYYYEKKHYIEAHEQAIAENRAERRKLDRCKRCAFATYTGAGVWFCMFPQCPFHS